MNVILAQSAIADLIAIGRHIARDNPARAETFVQELERKCHDLGDMPRSWPLVMHRKNKDIRRRAHGDYLIFYRIEHDAVYVVHVIHGAQNYETWLLDGE
jgi:plasmid stabilization system protein ParE